ncbi:lycopene cyclase family protein [Mycobacteroides abscessus subsp. abscessus]|nr:lycopene cyclase family protein [Mycobacteroides abscessus subsp. abscessus]
MPLGDGTVIFEETSLGLRGGMPQHVLRKRTLARLAAHGIRLTGEEPTEAAHYPLDQPPPRKGTARATRWRRCGRGRPGWCTGCACAVSTASAG